MEDGRVEGEREKTQVEIESSFFIFFFRFGVRHAALYAVLCFNSILFYLF